MNLSVGTSLRGGKYIIKKVLGQGTFGITYLATTKIKVKGELGEIDVNSNVAIKEFYMSDLSARKNGSGTVEGSSSYIFINYLHKFRKEAENLAKLSHKNIVNILEIFEENNTCYYVMEFIEGENLDDYITRKGKLPEDEATDIIREIGSALIYMHSNHMLHLDIKPKNVMRSTDNRNILIDFGLSKQYSEDGEPESSSSIGLGTPGYAPIEQSHYRQDGSFPATLDVYALGATFYKMLTGQRAPVSSTILNEGFDTTLLENAGVTENTIFVIMKAMTPAKKDRFQTIGDFIEALPFTSTEGEDCSRSDDKGNHGDDDERTHFEDEETCFEDEETHYEDEKTPIEKKKGLHDTNKDKSEDINKKNIKDNKQKTPKPAANKLKIAAICSAAIITVVTGAYFILRDNPDKKTYWDYLSSGNLKGMQELAKKGYIDCFATLGDWYKNGTGPDKNTNLRTAANYYLQAAKTDANSAYELGNIYLEGKDGVLINPDSAIYWLNISKEILNKNGTTIPKSYVSGGASFPSMENITSSISQAENEKAIAFKSDYSDLKIGDYVYEDGTFSHKQYGGKTAIGIVFSLKTSPTEKAKGYTHGQFVALEDAGETDWGKEELDLPTPHNNIVMNLNTNAIIQEVKKDIDGYRYSNSPLVSDFNAFKAASKYNAKLPANTTGWYLPSVGQMAAILENIEGYKLGIPANGYVDIMLDPNFEGKNTLNFDKGAYEYWTSSERSSYYVWIYSPRKTGYSLGALEFGRKGMSGKIRSVAAF